MQPPELHYALEEDLLRIQSSSDNINVHLRTADATLDATVNKKSQVRDAVRLALGKAAIGMQILLSGESIVEGSFEDHGVQEDATIDVVREEFDFEKVLDDIMALNPHIKDRESLTKHRVVFNEDGTLQSWGLSLRGLRELPESFGNITVDSDLDLQHNELSSLPESFGGVTFGGHLYLQANRLSSLPESFKDITFPGNLRLNNNPLSSLPASFGSISVGGDLSLNDCQLRSLPNSFGSITLGGALALWGCQLRSLPESFGNLTVNGDLHLNGNQLSSLPEGFGNLTVTGRLFLSNNQLSSLPQSCQQLNVAGGLYVDRNQLTEQNLAHLPTSLEVKC